MRTFNDLTFRPDLKLRGFQTQVLPAVEIFPFKESLMMSAGCT